jgi:hypothetical protein
MSTRHRRSIEDDDLDGLDTGNILDPGSMREEAMRVRRRVKNNLKEEGEDPAPDDQIPSVFVRAKKSSRIWPDPALGPPSRISSLSCYYPPLKTKKQASRREDSDDDESVDHSPITNQKKALTRREDSDDDESADNIPITNQRKALIRREDSNHDKYSQAIPQRNPPKIPRKQIETDTRRIDSHDYIPANKLLTDPRRLDSHDYIPARTLLTDPRRIDRYDYKPASVDSEYSLALCGIAPFSKQPHGAMNDILRNISSVLPTAKPRRDEQHKPEIRWPSGRPSMQQSQHVRWPSSDSSRHSMDQPQKIRWPAPDDDSSRRASLFTHGAHPSSAPVWPQDRDPWRHHQGP